MSREQELFLEKNIPGKKVEPVKYEGPAEFEIGGYQIKYMPFDSRLSPNVSLLYFDPKESVKMSDGLGDALAEHINEFIAEQKKFKKLGKPREQIKLVQGEQVIEVSNYLSPLSAGQIKEIKKWFSTLNSLSKDKFEYLKNVIILPSEGQKLPSGEPVNGIFRRALGGIVLYPPALEDKKHRTGGVSHLAGTLCHEYFHQYNTIPGASKLATEWMKLGGWHFNFKYPEKIEGHEELSDYENFVETDYGLNSSTEEFCDSAIKAIYSRNEFKDTKKLEFIDENFIDFKGSIADEGMQVIKKEITETPDLPRKFSFGIMAVTN
jgi:hypothetical protein